jgi:hypothetical protein
MGVIFQNGFGVGTVPNNTGFWNPTYTSQGLISYPGIYSYLNGGPYNFTVYDSTITDVEPGVFSALAKTAITTGQKCVITYGLDFDMEFSDPNYFLGFGTTNTNLNTYIGVDTHSIGVSNTGTVTYNDGEVNTGYNLPTFGTVGDIIDVAIDYDNAFMWYRVNGGPWNGDVSVDLSTNILSPIEVPNSVTIYPAISLFGMSGPSAFSVYQSTPYGLPSGFTQIAGDRPGGPSFTITSSMFDGGGWANSICGNVYGEWSNGLTGFTVSQSSNLYCGVNAQLTTYASVLAAFTAAGAALDWHGYVCSVNWGTGSTISNGYAKVAYEQGNHGIYIEPIDTTDTDYLINNDNANDSISLAGTFNFPATFTILAPLISKGGWC